MIDSTANKKIVFWLWIGFGMILIQILLGGITRLTGSGLSITHWDIVTGILYPFDDAKWNYYFDQYKHTPQYQKINLDINLSYFKFIFFWEYIHRLWARLMGLVFIIPLIYFIKKKWIDRNLGIRLLIVILLAVIVASLGWIMVASGLVQMPWVNAYKLSFHLMAALTLLSFLFYTILKTKGIQPIPERSLLFNLFINGLLVLVTLQLFLGGIMAGMKAGLVAPTWPKIDEKWIPDQVFHLSSFYNGLFTEYELSHSGPLIIQFMHRSLAYFICAAILLFSLIAGITRLKVLGLIVLCSLQMFLGIWTVLHCIGYVPLWPAVFHQIIGISMLIYILWLKLTLRQEMLINERTR